MQNDICQIPTHICNALLTTAAHLARVPSDYLHIDPYQFINLTTRGKSIEIGNIELIDTQPTSQTYRLSLFDLPAGDITIYDYDETN